MASTVWLGAVGDVAASHHGALTRRQAAEAGASANVVARLIARGVLDEMAPGLLVVRGSADTFERRVHAASLLAGRRGAVGGHAAGWLHRIDGVATEPSRIRLLVPASARVEVGSLPIDVVRTRAGFPVRDVVEFGSIRTLGLARTVCDLAGIAPELTEQFVDDFERRGASLRWLETTVLDLRVRGRSGPGDVLRDIERRRARRAAGGKVRGSWFQKLLADCLRSPILVGLAEEYEVRNDEGRLVARCDLAVPWVRLAIEARSRQFHFGDGPEALDEDRDNRLGEVGWEVRHVGWAALDRRPAEVRAYLERSVLRRARDLGLRPPRVRSVRGSSPSS